MICCVVLLLVAGALRSVLLTLLPGRSRHEQVPFPPAARRTFGDDDAVAVGSPSGAALPRRAGARRGRQTVGSWLVAAGVAWFAAGLLAMHVLGIVPHAVGGSVWLDAAFHLSGPLVGSVGLVLRTPAGSRQGARPPGPPRAARTTA